MEKTILTCKMDGSTSLCPFTAAMKLKRKKIDVLIAAQQFFCDYIKNEVTEKHYQKDDFMGWCDWQNDAISIVAINIQQRHPEIRFKKLIHFCEYDQLIKLAMELDNINDVKALLYVCQNKQEHKKFFAVVKESFENNNEIVPFFGLIEEPEKEKDDEKDYYCTQEREQMKQKFAKIGRAAFITAGIMILAASVYLSF